MTIVTLIITHVARRRTCEEMLDAVRLGPNHNTALERVEGLRLDIPFGLVRLRNRRSLPTSDVHSRTCCEVYCDRTCANACMSNASSIIYTRQLLQ